MVRTHVLLSLLLILAGVFVAMPQAHAQAYTDLYNFQFADSPIDTGIGLVQQGTDGNFYGLTSCTSDTLRNTVFKMTPSGTVTFLHHFQDGSVTNDGIDPSGLVEGTDGNFYGTTYAGGSTAAIDTHSLPAGYGTMYKITSSGTYTILHNFGDGTVSHDGIGPEGLVLGTDGNFYGVTYGGGSTLASSLYGSGTVFKATPTGAVTILHNFGDGSVVNDGYHPGGLIQGNDGNFYGTTSNEFGGYSTVFKITPSGTETILHNFADGTVVNDGAGPDGLVQGRDGNLYGTTYGGGYSVSVSSGEGTVFKITPSGTETVIHAFGDGTVPDDGAYPDGLLQGTDGNFYGVTIQGGNTDSGPGTVYRITSSGTETILHNFEDVLNGGFGPDDLLQGTDGNLYGATEGGATSQSSPPVYLGDGIIFRLSPDAVSLTIISISPSSATAGDPAFSLTITGTGFSSASTVTFGGTPVTVMAQTATQLTVIVPASAIVTAGEKTVAVMKSGNSTATALFNVSVHWSAQDVAAVSDGTARLLWDRGDGAAGIWVLSAGDTQTLAGPTYGPYTGWTAQDITAAADGTSRILWNRYDGATGVWALDARGNQTSVSPTYGPFSGWKAIDLAAAPNGTSRLMWRYTNGEAGILTLSAAGGEIIVGRNYGPYTGWAATAVGAAGDGTARMLWTRSDGAMGLWSMDANDLQASVGPTYGPYSDSHGRWTATDMSTSSDGTSEVLWKRSDGAIGVWNFSDANTMTTVGSVYGPYPGFTAAALDASGDKARVLWVRSDRAAGLWSFGSNDAETLIGPLYGPY